LQAFFNSVPDGSTIVFPEGACYRVEGSLDLVDRNNLTFEGNGAILESFTDGTGFVQDLATRYHVFCQGGTNLTFTGLAIEGTNTTHSYNPAYQDQAGFWVWGTEGLTLTHDTVYDVLGDFVFLGPDTYNTWKWATNVTISGDTFFGSGRQGIAITGAENVSITGNRMSGAALSMFDIEPDSGTGPDVNGIPTYGGAANITISQNTIGKAGTTFLSAAGADGTVTGVTVEDNSLVNQPMNMIIAGYATVPRSGFQIIGNTTTGNEFGSPLALVNLTYVNQAAVSGDVSPLYGPEDMTAVAVYGCHNVLVNGNQFPGATRYVSVDSGGWTGTPSSGIEVSNNQGQLPSNGRRS